ncbi:MAG: cytochrome b/b6 domain-containing protein [Pseudomonadota bacterium]|nr:cytochrome b/b6 domain-containing protein [Pseudomonadota bacterium]
MSAVSQEPAAWDLSTRVFHWLLAVLVVFSFTTGKIGGPWLEWHMRSGYAILALLLFRLGWGLVGSRNARFVEFVRGPRAAAVHLREILAGRIPVAAGHNPLGGWMVIAMLALLLLQAATGLFANDESSHEGPLAKMVSNAVVDRMSVIHELNQWIVVAAASLHVVAVLFYQWVLKVNLMRPMISGPQALPMRAVILLLLSVAAVYALVVIYPGAR